MDIVSGTMSFPLFLPSGISFNTFIHGIRKYDEGADTGYAQRQNFGVAQRQHRAAGKVYRVNEPAYQVVRGYGKGIYPFVCVAFCDERNGPVIIRYANYPLGHDFRVFLICYDIALLNRVRVNALGDKQTALLDNWIHTVGKCDINTKPQNILITVEIIAY